MNDISKNKKLGAKPRKETYPQFRFNRRRKHPSYVFKKENNRYRSILITYAPTTANKKNIKLYKNPKPNDTSQAYLIPKIYKDDISSYNKPYKNWKFHTYDRHNVKQIKKNKLKRD